MEHRAGEYREWLSRKEVNSGRKSIAVVGERTVRAGDRKVLLEGAPGGGLEPPSIRVQSHMRTVARNGDTRRELLVLR